jgi:hypothetical protein
MAMKKPGVICLGCKTRQFSLKCSHGCCASCCPTTRGNIKKRTCLHEKHRPKCPNCLTTISRNRFGNGVISCISCRKKFTLVPKLEDEVFNKHRIGEINSEFKREEYRDASKSRAVKDEFRLSQCKEYKAQFNEISTDMNELNIEHRRELELLTRELVKEYLKKRGDLNIKFEAVREERDARYKDFVNKVDGRTNSVRNLRKMVCLSNLLEDQGGVDRHCIHCIEDADNQLREHSPIDICHYCSINVCVNHLHLHKDCELSCEPPIELP